jgi:calcyclin binding protein
MNHLIYLQQHAFDESDKFVKLYIPFDGASTLKDENVQLDLNDDSFILLIETPAKTYRFAVKSLLHKIDVEKSYKKIKSNDGMIAVLLKKAKEGVTWKFLTATEKVLKDNKEKMFADKGEASEDPNNALMSIMKKMYESGDPEMKRTIAKAWTEGQEKNKGMPQF